MHIATLGDVMLDVIVDAPDGLHDDDDVKAQIEVTSGGQAANVAAWALVARRPRHRHRSARAGYDRVVRRRPAERRPASA